MQSSSCSVQSLEKVGVFVTGPYVGELRAGRSSRRERKADVPYGEPKSAVLETALSASMFATARRPAGRVTARPQDRGKLGMALVGTVERTKVVRTMRFGREER